MDCSFGLIYSYSQSTSLERLVHGLFWGRLLTSVFQLKISFYFIFPKPRSFFFQVILTQLVALVKKYSSIQTKEESIAVEKDEKSRILQDTCNRVMQQQLGFGA